MKYLKYLLFGFAAFLFAGSAAMAVEKGSADEAVALVKKAVAYLKVNGPEKAFAEFNNSQGQFINRDLYIFVQDMDGKILAHGANARLLGKNVLEVKDADGKAFSKAFIEIAKIKGSGWVDYKWPNPMTKAIESKSTYIEKTGDVLIGCGTYK